MPEGVQGWDRYGYVNNNPVKYNDPSGHTYCDFGKCHKPTGGKTNLQRALETAEIRFNEKESKGVTTFWWGLDEYERYTLEVGGWTEGEYTDYITTSNRNAYLWEDPATYIILIITAGKILWGLTTIASTDKNYTNEVDALYKFLETIKDSTGRNTPSNLKEQLAMEQVLADPLNFTPMNNVIMNDPRWSAMDGWIKVKQIINGVEIHYLYNIMTKDFADFKFK